MYDEYGIEVEVRSEIGDGYRLKISVTSIGMYIDGKWIHTPEFSTKTDFWDQLEQSCLNAINDYGSGTPYIGKDTVITDIPDEPINLDDIPEFGS
jgi:hypothetical protein